MAILSHIQFAFSFAENAWRFALQRVSTHAEHIITNDGEQKLIKSQDDTFFVGAVACPARKRE